MVIQNGTACLTFDSRCLHTLSPNGEKMVPVDNLSSDYEYSTSTSSYSSGIGSSSDINHAPVTFKPKPNSSVDEKNIEMRQILAEHRKNLCKHLDNIDSMINNQFNKGQQCKTWKYLIQQNEVIIRESISETKDEIEKLKNSIYIEMSEQVNFFEKSKIINLFLIGFLICASISIFCC